MPALHKPVLPHAAVGHGHLQRRGRHHHQEHSRPRGPRFPFRIVKRQSLDMGRPARHQFLPRARRPVQRHFSSQGIRWTREVLPGVVLLRQSAAIRRRAVVRAYSRNERRQPVQRKGFQGPHHAARTVRYRRGRICPSRQARRLQGDPLDGACVEKPHLPFRRHLPQVPRHFRVGRLSGGVCECQQGTHGKRRLFPVHRGRHSLRRPFPEFEDHQPGSDTLPGLRPFHVHYP